MPVYEYECKVCDAGKVERVKPLSRYDEPEPCPICGQGMRKLVSTPMFRVDNIRYQCPITGKAITSRKQHEENLLKQGCRVLERGEREEAEKFKKREDKELEDRIVDTAAKLVHSMPEDKKEKLANELASTNSVSYDRG